jgi:hypothetical protein
MRILVAIVLLALLPTHARSYESLTDALTAGSPVHGRCYLPETAVQYVIDAFSLGWKTNWPSTHSVGGVDVRAYGSANRRYCLLSKARWSEWGQYDSAEYAFVREDSVLLWSAHGPIAAAPIVSDLGAVALIQKAPEASAWPMVPIELVIVNALGDTLMYRPWLDHIARPWQRGYLDERYGFSLDGNHFLFTCNTALPNVYSVDQYDNTTLYGFDLQTGLEYTESLGPFYARSLQMTPDHAVLAGSWRDDFALGQTIGEGEYQIGWPWHIAKTITRQVTLPK